MGLRCRCPSRPARRERGGTRSELARVGFVETSRGCGKRVVEQSGRPVVGRGRTLRGFSGSSPPRGGMGETRQRVESAVVDPWWAPRVPRADSGLFDRRVEYVVVSLAVASRVEVVWFRAREVGSQAEGGSFGWVGDEEVPKPPRLLRGGSTNNWRKSMIK